MNKIHILKNISTHVAESKDIILDKEFFNSTNYRRCYNKLIRKSLNRDALGVYIWRNPNNEIIYIGKAGSIKNNGDFRNHTLQKRLIASRGKNEEGRDITTNDYIKKIVENKEYDKFIIEIYITKNNVIPAYVECILLNEYYKIHHRLPCINKSF